MLSNAAEREFLLSIGATPEQIAQFNADIRRALNIIEDSKPIQLNSAPPALDKAGEQTMQATGVFLSLGHSFESFSNNNIHANSLGHDPIIVNQDQIINNKNDLNSSAPVTFQYQAVPTTQTITSLENMSVAAYDPFYSALNIQEEFHHESLYVRDRTDKDRYFDQTLAIMRKNTHAPK